MSIFDVKNEPTPEQRVSIRAELSIYAVHQGWITMRQFKEMYDRER